jgi:tetratricopeptide (TPR) repeat protein
MFAVTVVSAAPARAADTDPNRPVRDKWALIVGVSQFQNSSIPKLKYAAKDARDFRDFLIREGNFASDHVRILLDEKATQRRVLSELGNKYLARVAKPDDLVVLFFSTHGSPAQADVRGKNFVVAYDSDPEDLYTTGIEMDKILESIQSRVLSERVLLVLDACHSGAVSPNAKGLARTANFDADALAQGSGQMVICSSLPDQQSWESKRYDNGIFTRKLLEGLRMKGKQTTLGDAFPYVQQSVSAEVQEDYGNRQSPSLRSQWNGNELILAAVPAAPQVLPAAVKEMLQPDSTIATPAARAIVRPVPLSAPTVTKLDANAHYRLGNSLIKAGKIDAALKEFRESFKLNSEGPIANHCLQLINYYATPIRATTRVAPTNYVNSMQSSITSGAPSSPTTSRGATRVSPDVIAQVKARLPRITPGKPAPRPSLAEALQWTLQDRANYYSEATQRADDASTSLEQAQKLLSAARQAGAPLTPNARAYGETEETYKARFAEGELALNQLLVPYTAEVEIRSKRADDEAALLRLCQSAYQQIYQSTTGFSVGKTSGKSK